MDALMIGLLGAALSTIGGGWWVVAGTMLQRGSTLSLIPIVVSAGLAAALSAMAGGWIAASVRGPGLLLLLALSLLAAGMGALWPKRAAPSATPSPGPLGAAIVLTAAQITEAAPFIIFAAAAWSDDVLLSGAGGAIGMIAALAANALPTLFVARVRTVAAALLLIVGAWCAVGALGLV